MLLLKAAAFLALAFSSVRAAYPAPGPCQGACYSKDPALVKRSDGVYFRFTTRDLIAIHRATNLAGPWTAVGSVIQGRSVIDLPGNDVLWAPDVRKVGNLYYLFYSVSQLGSRASAIGYATSSTLEPGSWTDHGAVVTSSDSSPYNAIDANLYDGASDGALYLQWGSYWQNIFTSPVTVGGGAVSRPTQAQNIAYFPTANHPQEGAFTWKHGGYWYLFMSRGRAGNFPDPANFPIGDAYHIIVCRGSSPTGPFVGQLGRSCLDGGGTTVLMSQGNIFAPGGQGVFHDDAHGDVLYYHYFNRNTGYGVYDTKFGWNVLNWVDGWPVAF